MKRLLLLCSTLLLCACQSEKVIYDHPAVRAGFVDDAGHFTPCGPSVAQEDDPPAKVIHAPRSHVADPPPVVCAHATTIIQGSDLAGMAKEDANKNIDKAREAYASDGLDSANYYVAYTKAAQSIDSYATCGPTATGTPAMWASLPPKPSPKAAENYAAMLEEQRKEALKEEQARQDGIIKERQVAAQEKLAKATEDQAQNGKEQTDQLKRQADAQERTATAQELSADVPHLQTTVSTGNGGNARF